MGTRHTAKIAVLAVSLLAAAAPAATPESGKIDDATSSTSWTGSFLTPNPGGSQVPVVCEEGTPTCDVFRFEVNVSEPSLDDDFITVAVEWPTPEMDIDLYVYNEATGEQVGSGTSFQGGSELAMIPPVNGRYRVEVIPWAVVASDYSGTVTYVKFEEDKSGVLGFAGALDPAALGGLVLLALGGLARRRRN